MKLPGIWTARSTEKSIKQAWQDGFTIQSAIGQANNLFTPIQLANYCAAIANGGTLYQPHFVRECENI